jgi:outer membrane murein-binding lipoprotein Lpp
MKTQNKLLASILLTAGIVSSPIISYAADSKELEDLRSQIEELKQAVKVLDRKGEIVVEDAAAAKKKDAVVSERALKHINELAEITYSKIIRPIICFVIQRTDVTSFQASLLDPIYKEAFNEAIKKGVEVIVLVVSWNAQGEATFITCDLPINY